MRSLRLCDKDLFGGLNAVSIRKSSSPQSSKNFIKESFTSDFRVSLLPRATDFDALSLMYDLVFANGVAAIMPQLQSRWKIDQGTD